MEDQLSSLISFSKNRLLGSVLGSLHTVGVFVGDWLMGDWLVGDWLVGWCSGEFTLLGRSSMRGTTSVHLNLLGKITSSRAGTSCSLTSVLFGKLTTVDKLSIDQLSALANLLVNELLVLEVDQRSGKSRDSA